MKNNRVLLETILITAITLLGMWFVPAAKTLFVLIPVAYLLIERRLRHQDWGGFARQLAVVHADGFSHPAADGAVGEGLLPRIPGARPGAAAL